MRKRIESDFVGKRQRPRLFEFGELSSARGATLQLNFNRQATIDGCRGIIDYYENLIKLKVLDGVVVFSGRGLSISSLSDTDVVIEGNIDTVEFLTRG